MSVLLAYATRYGATRTVAERIAREVPAGVTLDIAKAGSSTSNAEGIEGYDIVIIGGPIYAGKLKQNVIDFCETHRDVLSRRPVGLFVSCLYTGDKAMEQLDQGYPPWLLSRAFGKYVVGGTVHLDELSFFHKLIMRGVMKTREDIDALDEAEIGRLIAEVRARVS